MLSTLDYALIPTGSPRAGKSTLMELLVGKRESFVSQTSARGVAANVICPINLPDGTRAVHVFDIPGVDDPRSRNRDMEIAFAMSRVQIVLSFIGSEGGRPIAADVRAFLDVKEAFGLRPESVLFVFNRSPKFESTEEHKQHQADILLLVSSAIDIPKERMQFVFIDTLENADDLECEQAVESRDKLYTAISRCVAAAEHYKLVEQMECDSKAIIPPQELLPSWQENNGAFVFTSYEVLGEAVNKWCDDDTRAEAKSLHGHISTWNTSQITSMRELFMDKSDFNDDISQWDVSNVTDMSGMFHGATNFDQPIGSWDVSNANNMSGMFFKATSFNQSIGLWFISKAADTSRMFYDATNFNQPIGSWNVRKMISIQEMFNRGSGITASIALNKEQNTEEGGGETMPQWYRPFNEMFRDVVILESAAASAQSKAKVVVFGTVAQYVSERWGIQASCSLVYGPLKREPICFISIHPTLSDNKLSPGTLCTELSSHFSDETSLAIQVIAASVTRDKLLNMEFLSLKNDMWDGLLDGLQPPEHYLTQFPVAFECNVFVGPTYDYDTCSWARSPSLWVYCANPLVRCCYLNERDERVSSHQGLPVLYFHGGLNPQHALTNTKVWEQNKWHHGDMRVGKRICFRCGRHCNTATLGPPLRLLLPEAERDMCPANWFVTSAHLFRTRTGQYVGPTGYVPIHDGTNKKVIGQYIGIHRELQTVHLAVVALEKTTCLKADFRASILVSASGKLCPFSSAKPIAALDENLQSKDLYKSGASTGVTVGKVVGWGTYIKPDISSQGTLKGCGLSYLLAVRKGPLDIGESRISENLQVRLDYGSPKFSSDGDSGAPCFVLDRNGEAELVGLVRACLEYLPHLTAVQLFPCHSVPDLTKWTQGLIYSSRNFAPEEATIEEETSSFPSCNVT